VLQSYKNKKRKVLKYEIAKEKEFIEEFLTAYTDRGFGSLSKREIDVLLMHLLMKYSDVSSKSNHRLSIDFLISPTKIKNLRYEAKLKYSRVDNSFKTEFFQLLGKVKFKQQQNDIWIMLSVEDELLKQYIQAKIKEKGSFTDSSFNSEIVKVELNDFVNLLDELFDESEKIKITNVLNQLAEQKDNKFKEIMFKFCEGLADGTGNELGKLGVKTLTGGISGLFDLADIFKNLMRRER